MSSIKYKLEYTSYKKVLWNPSLSAFAPIPLQIIIIIFNNDIKIYLKAYKFVNLHITKS